MNRLWLATLAFLLAAPASGGPVMQACLIRAVERLAPKPWKFPPDVEIQLEAIWASSELTEAQKARQAYDLLLEAKLKQLSPSKQREMRETIEDALQQKSKFAQQSVQKRARYNVEAKRVVLPLPAYPADIDIPDLIIAIHELEHAFDFQTRSLIGPSYEKVEFLEKLLGSRTAALGLEMYRTEAIAIGAQWELVSRIPADTRAAMIQRLRQLQAHRNRMTDLKYTVQGRVRSSLALSKGGPTEKLVDQIVSELVVKGRMTETEAAEFKKSFQLTVLKHNFLFKDLRGDLQNGREGFIKLALASLENADLPKDTFVKAVAPSHNYTPGSLISASKRAPFEPLEVLKARLLTAAILGVAMEVVEQATDPNVLDQYLDDLANFYAHLMREGQ